jgi:hypothetical protein
MRIPSAQVIVPSPLSVEAPTPARESPHERMPLAERALGVPGSDAGAEPTPNREFNDLWVRFVGSVAAFSRQSSERTDLSRVASSWIGETEKSLDVVFKNAERRGAALVLEEADALFKRP